MSRLMVSGSPGRASGLKVSYEKDGVIGFVIPPEPNIDDPIQSFPPNEPTGAGQGDMLREVYDKDGNGIVDRVDRVEIEEVVGLRPELDKIAADAAAAATGKVMTVLNNGPDYILPGHPVALHLDVYYRATSEAPKHKLVGIAVSGAEPGSFMRIQDSGLLKLPELVWDDVLETVGGLALNGSYYLSPNGTITVTPPSESPHYLVKVGYAASRTELYVDPDIVVKL